MSSNVPENEKELIDRALHQMRSSKRGKSIPAGKVKVFIAKVGEALKSSGQLDKTRINQLVQQRKDGEL